MHSRHPILKNVFEIGLNLSVINSFGETLKHAGNGLTPSRALYVICLTSYKSTA